MGRGFIEEILSKIRDGRLQSGLNSREIRFGEYVACPDRRQLLRNGKAVALNGKAFDLLVAFLESGGRVVRRDDLYERLWGEQVVEEANLSQTIYLLRRALDPVGDGRTFIETIPRIGYRFAIPLVEPTAFPARLRLGLIQVAVVGILVLTVGVLASAVAAHRSEISPSARDADELGEYHLALRTPDHLWYALSYFEQARRAAPDDAFAYAGVASTYALLAEFQRNGSARQRSFVALAEANGAAALRHRADFSPAFAVRGFIAYRFKNDSASGAHDLKRALTLDPDDAQAHLWYGVLLLRNGNLSASTSELQAAHRLAPTSEVNSRWLARAYEFERKPDAAIAQAHEALALEPDDAPAMLVIAGAQEQRGELRSALRTLQTLLREDPYERPFVVPDQARLELRLGRANMAYRARQITKLAASGRIDPFETALLYLTLGKKSSAMDMLRLANRSSFAIQRYDPRLLAVL
jgi:DNA-binding winged helix-turn-helix (wHTH) protein/Tfp pilus assembly protein PilF